MPILTLRSRVPQHGVAAVGDEERVEPIRVEQGGLADVFRVEASTPTRELERTLAGYDRYR